MKKKLIAAFLVAATLSAGVAGLTACNTKNTPSEPTPPSHSHNWGDGWTVTEANKPDATREGKATRTCTGAGDCDGAKEYTLPNLMSEDYTITNNTATVGNAGTGTYTYNKNGVNVSFTAETPALEPEHSHNWGDGWTVTEENKPDANRPGKATRTCTGAGDCDGAKEYILPVLSKENYTLTNDTATCAAAGTATYTYNKNDVTVSFSADSPVNADNHTYDTSKWLSNGTEHWHAANCGHNEVDNVLNTSDAADHVTGADGYCTVCYTTALTTIQNKFNFVAGNGINFTAFVYGMSGASYEFSYTGTAAVEVEYGGYSDQGVFSSQTATLADGDSFNFTLTGNQDVIKITSDSAEQVTGTIIRLAELGENDGGYPVTPSKEGEKYTFTAVGSGEFSYVMTVDNDKAEIYTDGESGRELITLPYKFKLSSGAKKNFYMSYAGDDVVAGYNVAIDREWDLGSEMNSKKVELGVDLNETVSSAYYYSFHPTENGWYKISSSTTNATLIAGDITYGEFGTGFDYFVRITSFEDGSDYNDDIYYSFQLASLGGGEISCDFKIEKVDDATALAINTAKTGNNVYTFTASPEGTDYMLTVSEVPASGYWTIVYENDGIKTLLNVTSTQAIFSPTANTAFTVIYGNTAGSVTLAENDSALQISLGVSPSLAANTIRYFRVPANGTYTFTTSSSLSNGNFWKVNDEMYMTATVTLEGLKENDVITIQYASVGTTTVTILPENYVKITASASADITVNKGVETFIYAAGTAGIVYRVTLSGEGVQFVGGGTVKEITADAGGNIKAFVEYTGAAESASATVTIEQVPYELQLNTDYVSDNKLTANVVYSFTATEAGNYVISGFKVYGASRSITVNGVEHKYTDATSGTAVTSFTVENVAAGETVTFSISNITSSMTIRVDGPVAAE